jgi:Tfp pilus assembly protein PilX
MKPRNLPISQALRRSKAKTERGIALITTLLLLLLLTGISITMVLSVSSDMLVNGYYRDFRGSFYASDSGLNLARQSMLAGVTNVVPAVFDPVTPPIPSTTASTVASNVYGNYSGSNAPYSLNTGGGANSWPEKFTLTKATLTAAPGSPTTTKDAKGNVNSYTYTFNYNLTAVGQSQGSEAATVSDSGAFKIVVAPGSSTTTSSFAAFGMFIDQYALCGGGDLVPGTITGPVFTNGAWNFSSSGAYEFTDQVKSANSQAGYDNGSCVKSSALSANGITPKFDAGFLMGQPALPLPANDFNQREAVIDSLGNQGSALTQAQLTNSLKDASGTAYPSSGTPASGVYLPYSIDPVTKQATLTGGGIMVEGDAQVSLSLPTNGNTTAQIYTIVQGGVTTTVTIDVGAGSSGTTTITSSATGKTQTITGVPVQRDPGTGGIVRDATMLYVDGNITALSGPGAGKPGISDATALTVTAKGDVTVTGDILYNTEPVTQAANQIPGTQADTLIPGSDHGQVLGIFTGTGNVNLANKQSSGNLEIDASIATVSQGGSGGIVNTGSAIGTLNIVGGRIQNTIQNINSSKRNVFFDRRFASNGFAPPWFPSTTVTTTGPAPTLVTSSVQRLQWLNQTNYQ